MRKGNQKRAQISPLQATLLALSEDMALPLLQIKSGVELLEQQNYSRAQLKSQLSRMSASAEEGLNLIEAYRLALRSARVNDQALEPVAISAILNDVAHKLSPFAKEYATDLRVDVTGRITPVLAHQPSLEIALEVLGASLIRAQASHQKRKRYQILLGAHKAQEGIVSAGVFSNLGGFSDKALSSARNLAGRARQPLPNMPVGAASGVLIADMLCAAMWQPLRAAAHGGLHGLATSVPISKQLKLI